MRCLLIIAKCLSKGILISKNAFCKLLARTHNGFCIAIARAFASYETTNAT